MVDKLQQSGRLKIERYRGNTHLIPIVKDDARHRSTSGDKLFYDRRGRFIEVILEHKHLTPAERLACIGIAALTDPDDYQCHEGQTEIARLIGVSRYTMIKTVNKLCASDSFHGSQRQVRRCPDGSPVKSPVN